MKIFFSLIILICITSCSNFTETKIIEGDIYIKLIDAGSFYGSSEEKIQEFKENINNVKENSLDDSSDKKLLDYYKKLIEYDLFDKPNFQMKLSDNNIIRVFCEEENYFKIKKIINGLNYDTHKIKVKFKGELKGDNIYYAYEILSLEKIEGKTDWKK